MTPIRQDVAAIRLETSSLLLRPWQERDREAMADIQPPGHELRPHMVFRIRNPALPAGEGS